MLEKTPENPLDCKKIKPVNPKGNQPLTFIGRTDSEAEAPIIWQPYVKSQLIGKDPNDEDRRRRGWQSMKWWEGITDSKDMNVSKLCDIVKDREAWNDVVHGAAKSWTLLND